MIAFVTRRCIYAVSSRSTGTLFVSLVRKPISLTRPLSLTPINHNFPNMQQMMDELSKNPKAMALFQAIKKDPKIMQTMQELIITLTKKGYLDLKNPTKQPSTSKSHLIIDSFRQFQVLPCLLIRKFVLNYSN